MVVQENSKENIDELAITKAAAWAWYERGSWFEHNSIRETDCRRTSDYIRRPSRYKLEAMKTPEINETLDSHPCVNSSLLCTERVQNSLFDMYEIERISKDLDCYVESSAVKHRRKSVAGGGHGDRRGVSLSEGTKGKRESKSKSEKRKGFWIGRPLTCGSSRDVVNSSLVIGGRRSQKEHVMVAGIMNFRRPIIHG
ncbi:hypothetical protein L2E82_11229 [Cichorium intybus]|uniref:Uncharacterized protein n=1 Tax=Cichorium intybus TaxID=13427 RepID=A0ACB9GDV5_CICIN|nr:hypothetical protein L2E82_11229 [Cichorium intybus]